MSYRMLSPVSICILYQLPYQPSPISLSSRCSLAPANMKSKRRRAPLPLPSERLGERALAVCAELSCRGKLCYLCLVSTALICIQMGPAGAGGKTGGCESAEGAGAGRRCRCVAGNAHTKTFKGSRCTCGMGFQGTYRKSLKGLYVVARYFFLVLLSFSACPCLAVA